MSVKYKYDHELVTLEDEPELRFIVMHDDCTSDPIKDSGCPVEYYAIRGGYHSVIENNTGQWIDRFKQFYDALGTIDLAIIALRRFAVVFEGWTTEAAENRIGIHNHIGNSQSDWLTILFVIAEDGYGYYEGWAEEWDQWANGNVYCVYAETKLECDSDECHLDEDDHWTRTSDQGIEHMSMGNIYAEDSEDAARQYWEMV